MIGTLQTLNIVLKVPGELTVSSSLTVALAAMLTPSLCAQPLIGSRKCNFWKSFKTEKDTFVGILGQLERVTSERAILQEVSSVKGFQITYLHSALMRHSALPRHYEATYSRTYTAKFPRKSAATDFNAFAEIIRLVSTHIIARGNYPIKIKSPVSS